MPTKRVIDSIFERCDAQLNEKLPVKHYLAAWKIIEPAFREAQMRLDNMEGRLKRERSQRKAEQRRNELLNSIEAMFDEAIGQLIEHGANVAPLEAIRPQLENMTLEELRSALSDPSLQNESAAIHTVENLYRVIARKNRDIERLNDELSGRG